MLKIWGRANSINVQKVLWAANEIGIAYERVDIGGPFGGDREPAYLALNPNGLIPTIEDDGFALWESNSIVRYLAASRNSPLWPQDPKARAEAERWMDWQLTSLPGMTVLFWGLVRTPPEKRDPAAIEAARVQTAASWAIVDRHLAGRPFLAGDSFTMGDIPVGAMAYRWLNLPIERPALPNLQAWYQRLAARPPYRTHVMPPMT
jgi:glutathione S-transferase